MWQHAHAPLHLHERLTHLMPCVHVPVPWLPVYAQAIITMMALQWQHATPLGVHTCWSHTNTYTVWPCKVAMSFGLRQCPCESACEGAAWNLNRHASVHLGHCDAHTGAEDEECTVAAPLVPFGPLLRKYLFSAPKCSSEVPDGLGRQVSAGVPTWSLGM